MRDKETLRTRFIIKANSRHNYNFDYSKVEYLNNKTNVTIICPIHGEFQQTPANHITPKGNGCGKCGDVKTAIYRQDSKEDFIIKANEIHNNFYDYTKTNYKHSTIHLAITCPEHGDFQQTSANHISGRGCPKCGVMKSVSSKKVNRNKLKLM